MFKNSIHHQDILKEIDYLVQNRVVENKQVEYKSELPDNSDRGIINCLLKPVCSFANTNDGYIIYGVKEENNMPFEVIGISSENIDDTKLRIENLIRDNTEDQIVGTDIAVHRLCEGDRFIIILKVRKSWYGPHREKKNNRFYGRNSAGSYPMGMVEIRNSINLASNLLDNVNKFKMGRLIDIESRQTIVPIESGGCMVLHVASLPAFMSSQQSRIDQLQNMKELLIPKKTFQSADWYRKIVLEGLLVINQPKRTAERYDLIFKTGKIESVTVFPSKQQFDGQIENYIPLDLCEISLISDVTRFLEMLKVLNVQPPIIIFLSFLGIGNYSLMNRSARLPRFDRNIIQISSEIIESFDIKVESIMRPLFDSVWNCCGLEKSENYNDSGEYIYPFNLLDTPFFKFQIYDLIT